MATVATHKQLVAHAKADALREAAAMLDGGTAAARMLARMAGEYEAAAGSVGGVVSNAVAQVRNVASLLDDLCAAQGKGIEYKNLYSLLQDYARTLNESADQLTV